MLLSPLASRAIADVESLFTGPAHDALRVKAQEELHSRLIIGFEEAIALGIPPLEALSQVLTWVAAEMDRIQRSQLES